MALWLYSEFRIGVFLTIKMYRSNTLDMFVRSIEILMEME